jgi:hypothetical protein
VRKFLLAAGVLLVACACAALLLATLRRTGWQAGRTTITVIGPGSRENTERALRNPPVIQVTYDDAEDQPEPSDAIARAFKGRQSGLQVSGNGVVTKVLPDDNKGSRHQRFVLRLSSGQTLLVAHNTDIAPRIRSLAAGDTVSFSGVYEWNPEGGTIHWTHHDPRRSHKPGWLEHRGRRYQ